MNILPSPCSLCPASCCRDMHITVTAFDLLRISARTGKAPDSFASLYPLRLLNFDTDTVLECHDSPDPRMMEERILCINSHPCVFLGVPGARCTIHDFAPSVCRAFPKGIDGRFRTRLCPAMAGFVFRVSGFGLDVRPEYRRELETYREIVAQWNRGRGKSAACMRFILGRAKEALETFRWPVSGRQQSAP